MAFFFRPSSQPLPLSHRVKYTSVTRLHDTVEFVIRYCDEYHLYRILRMMAFIAIAGVLVFNTWALEWWQ